MVDFIHKQSSDYSPALITPKINWAAVNHMIIKYEYRLSKETSKVFKRWAFNTHLKEKIAVKMHVMLGDSMPKLLIHRLGSIPAAVMLRHFIDNTSSLQYFSV